MAGECPSGTEDPDGPDTQPETSVASRIASAYPESITLFQEVHVPTPDDPEGLNAYIDLHGETPGPELPHPVHAATGLDPVPAPLGTAGEGGFSLGYSDVYSRFPSPVQVMEPGTTVLGATWQTPMGVMDHLFRINSWTECNADTGQLEFYFTIALELRWQGLSIWSWNSGVNKGRLGFVNYVSGLGAGVCGAFTVTRWVQATPGEILPPAVEVSRKTYEQRRLVFAQPFGEIDVSEGQDVDFCNLAGWLVQEVPEQKIIPLQPEETIRYRIQIHDAEGLVVADSGVRTGNMIAWAWDGPVVTARGTTRHPYRLIPADSLARDGTTGRASSREEQPRDSEAADDIETYIYDVEMSAPFYPDPVGCHEARSVATTAGQKLALHGVPVLEVLDPSTDKVIATSNRFGAEGMNQKQLLNAIFPAMEQGGRSSLRVRVRNLYPRGSEDEVWVDVNTQRSHPDTVGTRLQKTEPGTYIGTVDLPSLLQPIFPSFTTVETTIPVDSLAFAGAMLARGSVPMGKAVHEVESNPGEPDDILGVPFPGSREFFPKDVVRPTLSAFLSGGYETMRLVLRDPPDGNSPEALLRLKNQADVMYFSGHGFHATNKLEGLVGKLYDPTVGTLDDEVKVHSEINIHDYNLDRLKILVIAGCSVLDIHDYNDNFTGTRASGAAIGFEPGLEWFRLTGNGRAVLLGYNFTAPPDGRGPERIAKELVEEPRSVATTAWPDIWMHLNAAQDRLDSACAIDPDYYWYIRYREEVRPTSGWDALLHHGKYTVFHRGRALIKVPRSEWTKPRQTKNNHIQIVNEVLPDVYFFTDILE
jgi:hypothetical protein